MTATANLPLNKLDFLLGILTAGRRLDRRGHGLALRRGGRAAPAPLFGDLVTPRPDTRCDRGPTDAESPADAESAAVAEQAALEGDDGGE